jgi:3',5'-cyclic AMP phosphodiesterase CpdA
LANILSLAESRVTPESPSSFIFLGDFVDRGVHDHETLLLLFRLMMEHPERVCIIPGNHDIDLKFDESMNRFRVTIEPAEYCDALNAALQRATPDARERIELARAFMRFCASRPKALFFPDGTLFSHGGFPHLDVQKDIQSLADLCLPRCLDDFLWARIAETAKTKRPNRGSRGHEFGWDTFAQFCKVANDRLNLPVRRLVRGHDHVPDRWQEYPDYADNGVPVLTINAMGRVMEGELNRPGRPHPLPVVARCVNNHLPEVIQLPLDPSEVDRAFPKEGPRSVSTTNEPAPRSTEAEHAPTSAEQATEGRP